LIPRKIIKIVAIKCHILELTCTKFDFGWGSARDHAGGAYSAPPDSLAGFNGGPPSKGMEGRKDGERARKGRGPTSKARRRERRVSHPNLKTKLRPHAFA